MHKFFTTFEAAKICHVSQGSIIRWIHDGKLPAAVTPGGHHRIESKSLTLFLKQLHMPIPEELKEETMKFLVITENLLMARTLNKWLEAIHPEASVEEARDYFMAGWKASRLRPDMVILDLDLSGVSEVMKACELMRAFFEYKNTPLLILVSNPSVSVKKKIVSLGNSAWMPKPAEKDLFAEKVEMLLRKTLELKLNAG